MYNNSRMEVSFLIVATAGGESGGGLAEKKSICSIDLTQYFP